jgi:hypothetical protein
MESLRHAGEVYEVNSMYLLPDDAWTYELTPLPGGLGRASLMVLIPDATPDDGPFTPMSATHARVMAYDGDLPWLVLTRFLRLVETSGDFLADEADAPVVGDLSLSCTAWQFAGQSFEVNSYHFAEHDCWCYELYELNRAESDNDYFQVRIPDLQPAEGPFVPASAEQVTIHAHGSFTVPLPVFRHFLSTIRGSGDIVMP